MSVLIGAALGLSVANALPINKIKAAVGSRIESGEATFNLASSPTTTAGTTAFTDPVFIEGNQKCADDFIELKVEPAIDGTYSDNYLSVTVDFYDGPNGELLNWTSNNNVYYVIVKGGTNANGYAYPSGSTGDTGLHSPTNPVNNKYFEVSHVSFCYKYKLNVTKTAAGTYDRTITWSLSKSVNPAVQTGFVGMEAGTSEWTVTADKTVVESNFKVTGTITINNPAPAETGFTVSDVINGVTAIVTCPSYTVSGGESVVCTYTADMLDKTATSNTATVTPASTSFLPSSASAGINWTANVIGDESVTVDDSNNDAGSPQNVLISDDMTWKYTRKFTCSSNPADYANGIDQDNYENSATAKGTTTDLLASASVTVTCYAPVVTKDATAEWKKKYDWTITKSVDDDSHTGFAGDSFTSNYTVKVDQTLTETFKASGTIWVSNPASSPGNMIVSVADSVDGTAATVDCGGGAATLTVIPGSTGTCSYTVVLPDNTDRTNTATATFNSIGFTATADVHFGDPVIEGDPEITVKDSLQDNLGKVSDDTEFNYERPFACSTDLARYTNGVYSSKTDNTATIEETDQSDSESVTLTCYILTVAKDADTSLTRTWSWTIDKSADQTALTVSIGQQFLVNYSVAVNATSADSKWAVNGGISVHNPATMAATLTGVADLVSPAIAATVNCGVSFPYPLEAGATLNCTYSASLPNADSRTNTATATLQNTPSGTTDFGGTANVDFSNATINQVDECIDVSDTLQGALGTVCAGQSPKTFTYTRNIGPYLTCGDYTVDNTASFVTNDTSTTGRDSWTINVSVPCGGCNHTIGYWKTHAGFGPQADVVTEILEHITLGGVSVGNAAEAVTILSMDGDASNGLNKLRAQLLAAKLNTMGNYSGCSDSYTFNGMTYSFTPDQALETFAPGGSVSRWHDGYGWDKSRREAQAIKQMILRMAECIDAFNNSNHCSE